MSNQARIIAIYGGAFDPIHLGHIKIALHILAQPEIGELRLLPCNLHPHKDEIYAAPLHRYNMLKLVADDSLIVDRFELDSKGISYTADTAQYMREKQGADTPLALVLGLDAYATISNWHNAALLPSLLHLIVVARPKVRFDNSDNGWQPSDTLEEMACRPAGMVFFMNEPLIDISSSQIRSMVAQGIQPRYLVPGVVWNYIKRNRLYDYKETA